MAGLSAAPIDSVEGRPRPRPQGANEAERRARSRASLARDRSYRAPSNNRCDSNSLLIGSANIFICTRICFSVLIADWSSAIYNCQFCICAVIRESVAAMASRYCCGMDKSNEVESVIFYTIKQAT